MRLRKFSKLLYPYDMHLSAYSFGERIALDMGYQNEFRMDELRLCIAFTHLSNFRSCKLSAFNGNSFSISLVISFAVFECIEHFF